VHINSTLIGVSTVRRGREGCAAVNIWLQSIMYHWIALPVVKARWPVIGQLYACYSSFINSKLRAMLYSAVVWWSKRLATERHVSLDCCTGH